MWLVSCSQCSTAHAGFWWIVEDEGFFPDVVTAHTIATGHVVTYTPILGDSAHIPSLMAKARRQMRKELKERG